MSRTIIAQDKIGINEHHPLHFAGEVSFGRGLKKVPYTDIYGRKSFKYEFEEEYSRDPNIIPIGGYQFAFDKLFNIGLDQNSNLKVGDLNDETPGMKIGVRKNEYDSINMRREYNSKMKAPGNAVVNIPATNAIFGFMVGDGGSGLDNMTAIAPNYKNRLLYNPVPFRTTSAKMTKDDLGWNTYFGCTELSRESYQYYIKRFEPGMDPHIVNVWVSDGSESDIDDTVFSSTSTNAIETYVEMGLVIDAQDCRSADMTTAQRVNEIGLVSGWYNEAQNDYECIRLFSHFTRPSITLAEGDKIEIIYRIYAR